MTSIYFHTNKCSGNQYIPELQVSAHVEGGEASVHIAKGYDDLFLFCGREEAVRLAEIFADVATRLRERESVMRADTKKTERNSIAV